MLLSKASRLAKCALILSIPVLFACVAASTRANAQGDDLPTAAGRGDLSRVKELLAAGVDFNARMSSGKTALITASENGHLDVVQALLAKGADVNARASDDLKTALIWACINGYLPQALGVVQALLAAGADVNATAKFDYTALNWASSGGHLDIVKALLAAGADVNLNCPLEAAATNGHLDVVQALLAAGADVNANFHGTTAIDEATKYGYKDIAALLVQAGAHPIEDQSETKSQSGQTKLGNPKLDSELLAAISKGDVKRINALAGRGADVNSQGPSIGLDIVDVQAVPGGFRYRFKHARLTGPSQPMITAIDSHRADSVRALLALGADVKSEFFGGPQTGAGRVSIRTLADYAELGMGTSITGPDGAFLRVGSDGFVTSSIRPTPARKLTYLSVAEEQLLESRDAKERNELQQIVDLLRQAVQK